MIPARRQTAQRRDALMRQAGKLFWEYGYDRTSMRDIARVCGFKPANIYNYFGTKEQLLYAVIREDIGRVISALSHLETDESTSPEEQLRSLFKNHMACIADSGSSFRLITDSELRNLSAPHRRQIMKLRDKHDTILSAIIKRGTASGDFAAMDEKIVCFAIASMIVRSRIWFSSTGRLSVDQIANIMSGFALYGLKGRNPKRTQRSSTRTKPIKESMVS